MQGLCKGLNTYLPLPAPFGSVVCSGCPPCPIRNTFSPQTPLQHPLRNTPSPPTIQQHYNTHSATLPTPQQRYNTRHKPNYSATSTHNNAAPAVSTYLYSYNTTATILTAHTQPGDTTSKGVSSIIYLVKPCYY